MSAGNQLTAQGIHNLRRRAHSRGLRQQAAQLSAALQAIRRRAQEDAIRAAVEHNRQAQAAKPKPGVLRKLFSRKVGV